MAVKNRKYVYVSTTKVEGYAATSTFTTEAIDLRSHSGSWALQITRSLTDGTPTCTIQSSIDGTNWVDYDSLLVGFTLPTLKERDTFYPNYMRVIYTATGSPTGTITMIFNEVVE